MTRPNLLPVSSEPLRHGYTVADVHRMALGAASSRYTYHRLPHHERVDIAWGAIVGRIYTDEPYPTPGNLAIVGQNAISRATESTARHYGLDSQTFQPKHVFARYWATFPVPLEDRVVERVAVLQILATLPVMQRQALIALAIHCTSYAAAPTLGLSERAFRRHLRLARLAFDAAWYAPETPQARRIVHNGHRFARAVQDPPHGLHGVETCNPGLEVSRVA